MGFAVSSLWSDPPHSLCPWGRWGGRVGWWRLAGTMRSCSALHTSLVSPICSRPFFFSIPSHSIVIPTSFNATVSWRVSSPSGTSNKGKVYVSLCFHHPPQQYSNRVLKHMHWSCLCTISRSSPSLFLHLSCAVHFMSKVWKAWRPAALGTPHSTTPTQALHLSKRVKQWPLYFGFDLLYKIR